MNPEVVNQTAAGISNFGMMAVTAAFFLLLSSALMVACFRWFKHIIEGIIESHSDTMKELLSEERIQNQKLEEMLDSLRPETQLRIRNLVNTSFDLSVYEVCQMIKRILTENHIVDKDATKNKIRKYLTTLFEDRQSSFDLFRFGGQPISTYCNREWIEWLAEDVEREIYRDGGYDEALSHTNVKMTYDRIKLDFYHRMIPTSKK